MWFSSIYKSQWRILAVLHDIGPDLAVFPYKCWPKSFFTIITLISCEYSKNTSTVYLNRCWAAWRCFIVFTTHWLRMLAVKSFKLLLQLYSREHCCVWTSSTVISLSKVHPLEHCLSYALSCFSELLSKAELVETLNHIYLFLRQNTTQFKKKKIVSKSRWRVHKGLIHQVCTHKEPAHCGPSSAGLQLQKKQKI